MIALEILGVIIAIAALAFMYMTLSINAEANREDEVVSVIPLGEHPPEFLRAFAGAVGQPPRPGNAVALYQNGDEIFPPMLEAIAQARSSVHFATFIYGAGRVPETFAEAFCHAARRGVEVRVVLDRNGAGDIPRSLIERMRAAGCRVHWFRAAQWFDWTRYNRRAHRRLLVIDGETGFTGGVGIADPWAGHGEDSLHWRDSHVRVLGPAVADLQAAFIDTWNEATGELPLGAGYFPELARRGEVPVCFVRSNPANATSAAQRAMAALIAGASRSLWITNAYFVPSAAFIDALCRARARGVDVKILVPGPFHNKPAVRRASRRTWARLLAAEVELYEHQRTMVHAKVVIADGIVTMVGTINFDPRSFALNTECAAMALDADLAAQAARAFASDVTASRRVVADDLGRRSLVDRVLDAVCYWLRAQL